MANANKKIISKGKATEEKEKKPSKSPVTVEVVDGVFVFHGGRADTISQSARIRHWSLMTNASTATACSWS